MSRKTLYILVFSIALAGFAWTGFHLYKEISNPAAQSSAEVCLFKKTTGVPCPSCGTTRSVLFIMKGEAKNAATSNPLGFVLFIAMTLFPVWIAADWVRGKSSFYRFYFALEKTFKNKAVAYMSIGLIIGIWIWNMVHNL